MTALVNQNEFTKFYAQAGVNAYSIPQSSEYPHGGNPVSLTLTTAVDEGAPVTNNGSSLTILTEGMYSLCAAVQFTTSGSGVTNYGADIIIYMTSDVDPDRNQTTLAKGRMYIGNAIPDGASAVIPLSFIGYFNATDVVYVKFTNVSAAVDTISAGGTSSSLHVCKIY